MTARIRTSLNQVARRAVTIGVAGALASAIGVAAAFAQGTPAPGATAPAAHVPLAKPIGQPQRPQVYQSLIVMNSRGASLQNNKLVLTGIAPNTILFADRPVRAAGHAHTVHVLEEWAPSNTDADGFAKDPPNATVSVLNRDGTTVLDAVVVLKNPVLSGENLTFDVQVLEGNLNGADGPASVFIDIIGRPWTPVSFAGAARRTAWRGAWYRGAAYGAAAATATAVGAAAAYHPYYAPYAAPPYDPYYRPACGYYPYPPCY